MELKRDMTHFLTSFLEIQSEKWRGRNAVVVIFNARTDRKRLENWTRLKILIVSNIGKKILVLQTGT